MRKNSFIPNLALGQLLSILLGYPLLLAFLATAVAETVEQNPWGWIVVFELVYAGALWGLYSRSKPSQSRGQTRLTKRSDKATAAH